MDGSCGDVPGPSALDAIAALRATLREDLARGGLDDALSRYATSIAQSLRLDLVEVWLQPSSERVLQLSASHGRSAPHDAPPRLSFDATVPVARCASSGEPALHVAPAEAISDDTQRWMARESLVTHAVAPVLAADGVLGVLSVFSRRSLPRDVLVQLELVVDVLAADLERRRAAQQSGRFSNLLRSIEQACPMAMIALDEDCRVRFWNDAASKLFGWNRDEVSGLGLPILPAGTDPLLLQVFDEMLRGETHVGHPCRKRNQAGEVIDVLLWTWPVRDERGRVAGTLAIFVARGFIQHLGSRLERKLDLIASRRLASLVVHDLADTLTVIQGYASLMEENPTDPLTIRAMAAEVVRAADRASRVQLHSLALASGGRPPIPGVDPRDILTTVSRQIEHAGTGLTLRAAVHEDCGLLDVDAELLASLLADLVGRVAETRANGPFEVEAACNPVPRSLVVDLGLPASAEFDAFDIAPLDRLPAAPPRPRAITGVPLDVVRAAAEQCGGHLLDRLDDPSGPWVKLLVPRLTAERPDEVVSVEPLATAGRGTTILAVEDDESIRSLILTILTRAGYDVLIAGSASEAIDLWNRRQGAVSILLTDVVLPAMDGIQLARLLRSSSPGLPVILTSGFVDEATVDEAMPGSAIPLLSKPFTPRALRARVQAALAGGPAARGAESRLPSSAPLP